MSNRQANIPFLLLYCEYSFDEFHSIENCLDDETDETDEIDD